jgi:hypothetical protein
LPVSSRSVLFAAAVAIALPVGAVSALAQGAAPATTAPAPAAKPKMAPMHGHKAAAAKPMAAPSHDNAADLNAASLAAARSGQPFMPTPPAPGGPPRK